MNFKEQPFAASLAGAFGVLGGLVQALGLLRWTVLVPGLAAAYVAPGATELDKALATSAFDTANAYLGMGVGEHMGYLLTALFTVAVGVIIMKRWAAMSWIGFVLAVGVAFGMLELAQVPMAAMINAIAYIGLVALGRGTGRAGAVARAGDGSRGTGGGLVSVDPGRGGASCPFL